MPFSPEYQKIMLLKALRLEYFADFSVQIFISEKSFQDFEMFQA